MTFSVRQVIGAVVVAFCAGTLIAPVYGAREQPAPAAAPSFMFVEFMRPAPGKEAEWLGLERRIYKPMHQARVKNGDIQSWAAISRVVPGDDPNGGVYGTITTYKGWPDRTRSDWLALLKAVHPKEQLDPLVKQTEDTRKIVRSEIWQVLDQTGLASAVSK